MLNHGQIAQVFNDCFQVEYAIRLVGGGAEPLYTPAADAHQGRLVYREDFAASALHEAAHWCIASDKRRTLIDFGYDYIPPPRSDEQQEMFFRLELKVQSLERKFAAAAGVEFRVSADNLNADIQSFACSVRRYGVTTDAWLQTPTGQRAATFIAALRARAATDFTCLEPAWTE